MKCDVGLIGLATMGENLALNLESHGYSVAVYNRTYEKTEQFLRMRAEGKNVRGSESLREFILLLSSPRIILLMVKAGAAVDELLSQLLPLLSPGDIIIDGGNSFYHDTERRISELSGSGIHYIGMGVSGGEEGALHGPSLMPGGDEAAWPHVKKIFTDISAATKDGAKCCEWIGTGGSGHFVKMVHNGIEYADMQLISECYLLLKNVAGIGADEMADIFKHWNETELESYLIDITSSILTKKDCDGTLLLDHILDAAGQKGTGSWASIEALRLGSELTLITEAVYARTLSSLKEERVKASGIYPRPQYTLIQNKADFIRSMQKGLLAAKVIAYAQGFDLMRKAAQTYSWALDYSAIAGIWKAGCIIRSALLDQISSALRGGVVNLLISDEFVPVLSDAVPGLRRMVAVAAEAGIAAPALSSALAYFDGYTTACSGANLLQAQRDFFGAHTYERLDAPRGQHFHTEWGL